MVFAELQQDFNALKQCAPSFVGDDEDCDPAYDARDCDPSECDPVDYDEDGHVCNPVYCLPEAYDICNPEMNDDGGCDPHEDNW